MDVWMILLSVVLLISSGIIFIILGVKYLRGSREEKAEYKVVFLPYILGGSFSLTVGTILYVLYSGSVTEFALGVLSGLISALLISFFVAIRQYFSINRLIIAFIANTVSFFNTEANDLIARLLMEKSKKNLITYSSLSVSFVAEYIIYRKTPEFSMLLIMALTLALLALNFAKQQILYYRLKHGVYGTCHSEAKEIIAYIIEQMNDKNNSGGGLPKLIFTQEELDECLQANGGEEYAG